MTITHQVITNNTRTTKRYKTTHRQLVSHADRQKATETARQL